MDLIERAKEFAKQRHDSIGQLRKYTLKPYWTHTQAVAYRLYRLGVRPEVVAAAHLHDVLEDTPTERWEIDWHFGPDVAQLVWEVTDQSRPEDGNRAVRKAIDREHNARASAEGQNIKLSDLIDNSCSIAAHDPHFAKTYMAEKAQLLPLLTLGHPELLSEAWGILRAWERTQVQDHLKGRPHDAR